MLLCAELGMIDRGADLSAISMYPEEQEILMPPLTGVQILNQNVLNGNSGDGTMKVVEVRLVSNLLSQVTFGTPSSAH